VDRAIMTSRQPPERTDTIGGDDRPRQRVFAHVTNRPSRSWPLRCAMLGGCGVMLAIPRKRTKAISRRQTAPALPRLRRHAGRLKSRATVLVAAVVVGEDVFGIEPDCLNVVGDGAVELAGGLVRVASVVVGEGDVLF